MSCCATRTSPRCCCGSPGLTRNPTSWPWKGVPQDWPRRSMGRCLTSMAAFLGMAHGTLRSLCLGTPICFAGHIWHDHLPAGCKNYTHTGLCCQPIYKPLLPQSAWNVALVYYPKRMPRILHIGNNYIKPSKSPMLLFFGLALPLRMCRQQVADTNATALTHALRACAQLGGWRRLRTLVRKMEVGKFWADLGAWWAIKDH
jgi:hypothetical protein